jgi:hypothetical protein
VLAEYDIVEAAIIAPFKPIKGRKIKPGGKIVPRSAKAKPANTNFAHVRRLMDVFDTEMQITNPFDLTDPSWIRFMKEFAPQLLVSLLWDTGHVTDARDRMELTRLFRQRIRA